MLMDDIKFDRNLWMILGQIVLTWMENYLNSNYFGKFKFQKNLLKNYLNFKKNR